MKIIIITSLIMIFTLCNSLFGQTKTFNKDSLLQEIEILFSSIEEIHPNMFAVLSEEDFNKDLQKIKSEIKTDLNVFEFYKLIAPLVAKLGDGHTRLQFPYSQLKEQNGLFFPFSVDVNTKDSTIVIFKDYTKSEKTIPVGAEIISINNVSSKKLVAEMITYISGEKDFYKLNLLEYLFTPLLYVLYKTDEFEIEYMYKNDKNDILAEGISYSKRYEKNSKKNIVKKQKMYSFEQLSENKTAVIDFKGFRDFDAFEFFLDSVFTIIKQQKINNLIIDIRKNGGGNSKLGNEFFQYISPVPFNQFGRTTIKFSKLRNEYYRKYYNRKIFIFRKGSIVLGKKPKLKKLRKNKLRYTKNTFLLISHFTFSSAASFSWAFKYFDMGKVIGEESGGMAVCFGDIIRQKLPYSKMNFTVSHKKFYQYGATDSNNHGTIPDYEVPAEDALDFTIDMIENKK